MPRQATGIEIVATLSPTLLQGRNQLGKKVQGGDGAHVSRRSTPGGGPGAAPSSALAPPPFPPRRLASSPAELLEETPHISEQRFEDGTPKCPRIRIAVEEGPQPEAGQQALKSVCWRVAGRPTQHALVFLTVSMCPLHPAHHVRRCARWFVYAAWIACGPALANWHLLLSLRWQATEFMRAIDEDCLSTLLHTLDGAFGGRRQHILTYQAATNGSDADGALRSERLWQVVADLAVWRPDVAFYNASSQEEAAQHVFRVTRSVAEEGHKQTVSCHSGWGCSSAVRLQWDAPVHGLACGPCHLISAAPAFLALARALGTCRQCAATSVRCRRLQRPRKSRKGWKSCWCGTECSAAAALRRSCGPCWRCRA